VAEETYTLGEQPASRAATQDLRTRQVLNGEVFRNLLESPNADHNISTPVSAELNRALGEAEAEPRRRRTDPAALLGDLQARPAGKWEAAAVHGGRP
jgi:hypothetical protein